MSEDFDIADLPLAEDFYDTMALKTAVWQFLVDHFSTGVGQFKVHLFVTTEDDFWRRVTARKYRKYTRNDAQKEYNAAMAKEAKYRKLKRWSDETNKKHSAVQELRKGGILERARFYLIVTLRRLANTLAPL